MFSGFALLSAPPSCHHGRRASVASVDEGVPDLAPARDQIRSVVLGAELGRGSRSDLYRHRGSPSVIRCRPAIDESKGIRLWLGFKNV